MANCPKCRAELLQDFGLVTCSSCGNVSILDIMGDIQETAAPAEQMPPPLHQEAQAEAFPAEESANFENPFMNFDLNSNPEASHIETPVEESPPQESMNLSDYANSEFSQVKDGAFFYNVSISDIDSKEIREFLREAINDTRFGWDVQGIMAQVKHGELLLKNMSPVKASILINRIKRLPVKIRWEQYAITQVDQNL
jgi:hypothetical protein